MKTVFIEHNGLPIMVDPKDGYEGFRGISTSLIVLYPEGLKPVLVTVPRNSAGRSVAPPQSKLVISGFVNDYYIAYV